MIIGFKKQTINLLKTNVFSIRALEVSRLFIKWTSEASNDKNWKFCGFYPKLIHHLMDIGYKFWREEMMKSYIQQNRQNLYSIMRVIVHNTFNGVNCIVRVYFKVLKWGFFQEYRFCLCSFLLLRNYVRSHSPQKLLEKWKNIKKQSPSFCKTASVCYCCLIGILWNKTRLLKWFFVVSFFNPVGVTISWQMPKFRKSSTKWEFEKNN